MGVRRKLATADLILVGATFGLLSLGLVMVLSASSYEAMRDYGSPFHFAFHQLLAALVGLAGMAFFMNFDYHRLRRLAAPALAIAIILLAAVLVTGRSALGATRWINLGPLSIQPTEIAKLAMVVFLAAYFAGRPERVLSLSGLAVPAGILGLIVLLVMKQPDFGSTLIIMGLTTAMFILAGIRFSWLIAAGLAVLPGLVYLAKAKPYRAARLTAFLNPWAHRQDIGYQTIQSLLALGSGGILGLGLGQSRQKFLYLPEQHTDFIFAILGEELGLLGTLTVVALYFVFAWRGYRIAINAPDEFGSLLAAGLTSVVAFQAILNMMVISGSLPITGVTLPLLSYGGSSLAITLSCVGILLNISKHGTERRG
ncbi:MAG: putative lipid II flippase FtsW [Betaproteobacteria bacterium]